MEGSLLLLWITLFLIFFIIIVLNLYFYNQANTRRSKKKSSSRARIRRLERYKLSLFPILEEKIKEKILTDSDADFQKFVNEIRIRANFKYNVNRKAHSNDVNNKIKAHSMRYHTRFKRSLLNAINKNTPKLPFERVKMIESVFPLLKRVYFGPNLNKIVYTSMPRKFVFNLKPGTELPHVSTIIDLAYFLNISVNELLGYAYSQDPDNPRYYIKKKHLLFNKTRWREYNSPHYRRYFIPKANGKMRMISAPKYRLKMIQKKILKEILQKSEVPDVCKGFCTGKSIVDNAKPHLKAESMIKLDLEDFFPSLSFLHVYKVFLGFGYGRPVAGLLACLCTDVFRKKRYAPQGAPTSPMIANLYAKNLDARLNAFWTKMGFVYTRYADDIAISTKQTIHNLDKMVYYSLGIITDEELKPNLEKIKYYRKGHKKRITGIVVNDELNPDRQWCMKLRAQIHQFNENKEGLQKEEKERELNEIQGKIAFLHMVNPQKAQKFKKMIDGSPK